MALELAEAGVPFILNLNMADEARARGIKVNNLNTLSTSTFFILGNFQGELLYFLLRKVRGLKQSFSRKDVTKQSLVTR